MINLKQKYTGEKRTLKAIPKKNSIEFVMYDSNGDYLDSIFYMGTNKEALIAFLNRFATEHAVELDDRETYL